MLDMHHFDNILQFDSMSYCQFLLRNPFFVHLTLPLKRYWERNQNIFARIRKFEMLYLKMSCTNPNELLLSMLQNLSSCIMDSHLLKFLIFLHDYTDMVNQNHLHCMWLILDIFLPIQMHLQLAFFLDLFHKIPLRYFCPSRLLPLQFHLFLRRKLFSFRHLLQIL